MDEETVFFLESIEAKLRQFDRIGADYVKLIVVQEGWRDWLGLELKAIRRAIEALKNRE